MSSDPPAGGSRSGVTVRVHLPTHLRTLAEVEGKLRFELIGPPTLRELLDALESRHPVLRGTIRHQRTRERRAFIRYMAGGRDLSLDPPDTRLPEEVLSGKEPFRVVGAIAGG